MELLDGKKTAEKIYAGLQGRIGNLKVKPKLVAVLLGDNPASVIYLKRKSKAAETLGIDFGLKKLPVSTSQSELEKLISSLNEDPNTTGIIVQKPLPRQIDSEKIDLLVGQAKDIDGLNPNSKFVPATARGITELLDQYNIKVKNKIVVVVGASKLAGKPTGVELQKKGAIVTFCDENTADLAERTRQADILVVAVGKPKLIVAEMVKPEAVVVDVGINRTETGLVGDVDFENVSKKTSYVTPVPGGVGPMTVAALMENLVDTVQ